jgi:hypothetical protein
MQDFVSADENTLTDESRARKEVLGGNGVRAVKRLSAIHRAS